jgi:hypothetical protein
MSHLKDAQLEAQARWTFRNAEETSVARHAKFSAMKIVPGSMA